MKKLGTNKNAHLITFNHRTTSKVIALIVFCVLSTPTFAQSLKPVVNKGLNDIIVPLLGLVFILGLIIGIAINWKSLNHEDTRKAGFISLGMLMLYITIGIAVIGLAAAALSSMSINF